MAHFRGTVLGNRSAASRLGSKNSGVTVQAQSWQGKVVVNLWHDDKTGLDMAHVVLAQHFNQGTTQTIYRGPVGGPP